RARPHAARLQSRGLAPDPPAGGPRDLRGWVAEGGAAGIGTALYRATRRSSSDVHVTYWIIAALAAAHLFDRSWGHSRHIVTIAESTLVTHICHGGAGYSYHPVSARSGKISEISPFRARSGFSSRRR